MKGIKFSSFILFAMLTVGCGSKQNPDNTSADTVAQKQVPDQNDPNKKTVLFFGDSLTAGLGLDDASQAFPGVIAAKIDSLKLPYQVVNSGVSGETTAGGLARLDWILKKPIAIFMLELGANDGLRGTSVTETTQNLQAIIYKVKGKYPKAKIILLGMQVPPSMGPDYAKQFKNLFPQLAKKNNIGLVPFLLDGVAGNPKLNQADGIHPTATGAKILAANVWKVLQNELQ
jgi:acyl-CoA thioesterase-1